MLGPFATASRRTPIHQVSLLSHAACASMSTTTPTTTTTRDRGDRYGPIEWANNKCTQLSVSFSGVFDKKSAVSAAPCSVRWSRCHYSAHDASFANERLREFPPRLAADLLTGTMPADGLCVLLPISFAISLNSTGAVSS